MLLATTQEVPRRCLPKHSLLGHAQESGRAEGVPPGAAPTSEQARPRETAGFQERWALGRRAEPKQHYVGLPKGRRPRPSRCPTLPTVPEDPALAPQANACMGKGILRGQPQISHLKPVLLLSPTNDKTSTARGLCGPSPPSSDLPQTHPRAVRIAHLGRRGAWLSKLNSHRAAATRWVFSASMTASPACRRASPCKATCTCGNGPTARPSACRPPAPSSASSRSRPCRSRGPGARCGSRGPPGDVAGAGGGPRRRGSRHRAERRSLWAPVAKRQGPNNYHPIRPRKMGDSSCPVSQRGRRKTITQQKPDNYHCHPKKAPHIF